MTNDHYQGFKKESEGVIGKGPRDFEYDENMT